MNISTQTGALRSSALVLIVSGILGGCSDNQENDERAPTIRPVKIIEIEGGDRSEVAQFPAVIDASQVTDLSFQVGGLIQTLNVKESEDIEKGRVIAELDPRDFESNLASAQASFEVANNEYERAVRLSAEDAIAKSVLEQRLSQRDIAEAQLDSAKKALEDSVLIAPYTGVIAEVPVEAQQSVSAGTVIAKLIDVTKLEAMVNMPASFVVNVPVRENRTVTVQLDALPDQQIEAEFSEASLVADATSQTYAVSFSFQAPENLLVLPGMTATVTVNAAIDEGNEARPVRAPIASVQSDGQGQYVWLVNSDMKISRRDVTVEAGIGETVVIQSGLAAGDKIVGAGGAYLTDGMTVEQWQ